MGNKHTSTDRNKATAGDIPPNGGGVPVTARVRGLRLNDVKAPDRLRTGQPWVQRGSGTGSVGGSGGGGGGGDGGGGNVYACVSACVRVRRGGSGSVCTRA